ncbi:uncharacterized protein LOC126746435 [Anthonomus grandis grandis]|uniref:uncharacterized protein LOC126746435 n=1 Tax=Anthonomus grandis grandis TaxID=2921223 RepID=UPI0021660DEC|nr:uncharacterized protein LOC126746435 [Anthonomus grandis grandis]
MSYKEINEKLDFSSCKVQKQYIREPNLLRTLCINIISLIFFIISITFFFFYRKIIEIYLKFKIGNLYGGVLACEDLIFFMPDVSKCHITTVVYARSGKVDMVKRVKEIIQEKVFDEPDNYPKLTSTVHPFGGYYYRKKYQCNVNDVVKEIKLKNNKELTEEYLKKFTGEVTNSEFGKSGTLLWEIHVGSSSIKNKANGTYTYPIISRFHHSIADGTSLVSLLIQIFGDSSCQNYGEKLFQQKLKNPHQIRKETCVQKWLVLIITNLFKKALLYLELIFISFGRLAELNQLKQIDINPLHGTNYTGEKLCAWASEDKVECIPLVKSIKNRCQTKFTTVICTAVTASLSHYFKRNQYPIPEYMSGFITMLLDYPDVDMSKPVALRNKTGGSVFELPMLYGSKTLQEIFTTISQETSKQIRLADALAMTILLRFITYIPMTLLKLNYGWSAHTYILTNVPGGSHITTQDGWVFEKIIPIAPNMVKVGLSIALLSYDEKFQIGVLVEKKLIQSQQELQQIADDILFYIKALDNQTK